MIKILLLISVPLLCYSMEARRYPRAPRGAGMPKICCPNIVTSKEAVVFPPFSECKEDVYVVCESGKIGMYIGNGVYLDHRQDDAIKVKLECDDGRWVHDFPKNNSIYPETIKCL